MKTSEMISLALIADGAAGGMSSVGEARDRPVGTAPPARECDPGPAGAWQAVCRLDDILPDTGVCALVGGRQIAVFRLADGGLYALDNRDPNSGANVMSRGIVGDLEGEPVVASPLYKHHYALRTGRCLENPDTPLRTHAVELRDGLVYLLARDGADPCAAQ